MGKIFGSYKIKFKLEIKYNYLLYLQVFFIISIVETFKFFKNMSKKILVVEDDKMISSMYETKLKQDGYLVITADNGAQAIELASQEKPDIILLDIILPQIDGFQVLQELRNTESFRNIPIIMLTNLGTTEDKEKGEKLGATGYWVKASLTPAQVGEKMREYL